MSKSTEAGNLTLISMGQGQEKPAEACLDQYMKEGCWVFLDNVHLMQGWVRNLERKLEIAAENARMRTFGASFRRSPSTGRPEAILQSSIKVRGSISGAAGWILVESGV